MEQIVTIELFGESYRFETDSEPEKAKIVADLLLEEVIKAEKDLAGETPEMAKFAILIIAALNIASRNVDLKSDYSALLKRVSEKASDLIKRIDAGG